MGYVYVTKIDTFPNVVKIGETEDVDQRLRGLNHTGVPGRHILLYHCQLEDHRRLETATHEALARVRDHGEFFRVSAVTARRVIRETATRIRVTIVREWSNASLDVDDAAAIRRQLAKCEAELLEQYERSNTSNPFLRARVVKANARQRELMEEIERLRKRLADLGEPEE